MNHHYLARKLALLFILIISPCTFATSSDQVQARIDADLANGQPIVVHLTVALCDNINQGIVKVPETLGNGQDPKSNLYWGALYGVKTHLPRKGGWEKITAPKPADPRILERVVFYRTVLRDTKEVPIYIIADAWDGAHIKKSLQRYLRMTAGNAKEQVALSHQDKPLTLSAGGASHLLAFVGHNGLMDFTLKAPKPSQPNPPARSALILACASKDYFTEHLEMAGGHPLLLTTGLMAPEAYTLDAAIRAWASGKNTQAVTEAAAQAYHQYQKCGINGARRLFWGAP